jgi:hypothetical protein
VRRRKAAGGTEAAGERAARAVPGGATGSSLSRAELSRPLSISRANRAREERRRRGTSTLVAMNRQLALQGYPDGYTMTLGLFHSAQSLIERRLFCLKAVVVGFANSRSTPNQQSLRL